MGVMVLPGMDERDVRGSAKFTVNHFAARRTVCALEDEPGVRTVFVKPKNLPPRQ
jgi:hypothetical protein